MTPVIVGIIPAPKNSSPHMRIINGQNDRMNGMGNAQHQARIPNANHRLKAFGPLYPPDLWDINPPTSTPRVGAVMVVMTNAGKTIVLSSIIIVSM